MPALPHIGEGRPEHYRRTQLGGSSRIAPCPSQAPSRLQLPRRPTVAALNFPTGSASLPSSLTAWPRLFFVLLRWPEEDREALLHSLAIKQEYNAQDELAEADADAQRPRAARSERSSWGEVAEASGGWGGEAEWDEDEDADEEDEDEDEDLDEEDD